MKRIRAGAPSSSGRRARLLIVDDSAKVGGGQLSLAYYLAQPSRFDRSVLLLEGGPLVERMRESGTSVSVLPASGTFMRMRSLSRAIRSQNTDIVLVNSLRAAIAVSLTPKHGVARLLYVHELLSRAWLRTGRLGHIKYDFFRLWVLQRFDGLLANSRTTAATIPPAVRKPVRIAFPVSGIAEGADGDGDGDGDGIRIVYLGRVARWKGIDTLLRAFDRLVEEPSGSGVHVTIAGDAEFGDEDLMPEIFRRAEQWPDRFEYAGFVSDVGSLLAGSDLLFSGSLSAEPFGQVVVQALAAGTPVIASRGGGPEEIIASSGAGVFFPPGDAARVTELLLELHQDRDRLSRMAAATRAAATPFLDALLAKDLDRAIESLTSPR